MKVTVYFEAQIGAHMVAQFDEEATYMACLPALEALAESKGYIVTESLDFEQKDDDDRMISTVSWINAQIEIDNLKNV
jgi:hypothetical protein